MKGLPANAVEVLNACVAALEPVEEFTPENIKEALSESLVENLGLKPRVAFGPPRVALSGRRVSPPLFESMELLGKDETLRRLRALADTLG
jgi:glutamyl-tRNA synthetase